MRSLADTDRQIVAGSTDHSDGTRTLLLTNSVSVGKLFILSAPPFLYLQYGNNNNYTCLLHFCEDD